MTYIERSRLDGWAARFEERHGALHREAGATGPSGTVEAWRAADGATAVLEFFPSRELARARVGVILVRRGGYTVGVAEGGDLLAHHGGTRYVQSRTAAGGWSQQRYQRRRENQADELTRAVIDHALGMLGGGDARLDGLALGGDRRLCASVLEDPRLARLAGLPRREFFDVPDPRLAVLRETVRRAHAVKVTVSDPSVPMGVGQSG